MASESQRFVTYYMVWQMLDQDCRYLEMVKQQAARSKTSATEEMDLIASKVDLRKYPAPKGYAYPDELPRLRISGWEYVPFKLPSFGGLASMSPDELAARNEEDFKLIGNAEAESVNDRVRAKLGELRTEALTLFERLYKDVARNPKW